MGTFGLLAFVTTAVAGSMLAAAILLILDGMRARRRIDTLDAEIERQNDLIGTCARARSGRAA